MPLYTVPLISDNNEMASLKNDKQVRKLLHIKDKLTSKNMTNKEVSYLHIDLIDANLISISFQTSWESIQCYKRCNGCLAVNNYKPSYIIYLYICFIRIWHVDDLEIQWRGDALDYSIMDTLLLYTKMNNQVHILISCCVG